MKHTHKSWILPQNSFLPEFLHSSSSNPMHSHVFLMSSLVMLCPAGCPVCTTPSSTLSQPCVTRTSAMQHTPCRSELLHNAYSTLHCTHTGWNLVHILKGSKMSERIKSCCHAKILNILYRFVHIGIGHFFFNMLMQVEFHSLGQHVKKTYFLPRSSLASSWRWNKRAGWEAWRCWQST